MITLSEIAISIPASIELFEKYDFDYYQNGSQTLKKACEAKGLPYLEIASELNNLQRSAKIPYQLTLEDLSIDRLIDFINGQHHSNEAEILIYIEDQIHKLILSSANDLLPMLKELEVKFALLKKKLISHCEKEDQILFPYMRKLYQLRHDTELAKNLQRNLNIREPILLLTSEHRQVSKLFKEVKKIANDFTIPNNATKEYEKMIKNLKEFENEFHIHLHIENNILFPKFTTLTSNLFGQ